jgi:NADPH:quinone reductase-like Zn-dependent oxidoreductase
MNSAQRSEIMMTGALVLPAVTLPMTDHHAIGLRVWRPPRAEAVRAQPFILEELASGALKPRIDRTFPFGQIVAAHRYLEANAQMGKVVVTVS